MTRWAQTEDITRRHHQPVPEDRLPWVAALIDDAEDELSLLVPSLAERVAADMVPLERVQRVVADAVLRVMRNPEGLASYSQTTGPFSVSGTRAGTDGVTGIYFREEELARVRAPTAAPARSTRLALPSWRVP